MKAGLSHAVEEFSTAPMAAGKLMRDMFGEMDPSVFLQLAIPLVRSHPEKAGTQYLLTLLLINDLILGPLIDPAEFSFDQAIAIAKQLVKIEPLLDIKMVRRLLDSRASQDDLSKRIDNNAGVRLLEIMAAVSDGARILPMMAQLLQHANPKIRSKAALLVGRTNKNCKWVEQRLAEADPRVRANAVESLWGVDSEDAKKLFWAAVSDPDNRVAGNALMGLYRLGEVACIPLIVELLSHGQIDFRTTGIWVMRETGDPRFITLLARLIADADPLVRSSVFRAIATLKQAAAKYAAATNLRVQMFPVAGSEAGWKEVVATLWEQTFEGAQPVLGLRPTQFVLYEDLRLVTQYEATEKNRSESLSIAFALPRIALRDHPFHAQCEGAFRAALPHKRKCDSWLVLKYLSEAEREVVFTPIRVGKRILQIDDVPAPVASEAWLPADSKFQADDEAIMSTVESPGNRMLLPNSPMKAMQTLLLSLSQCRGSRQMVFVYHPEVTGTDWERWREIATAAIANKVNVHVIAFAAKRELGRLTARTGGTFTLLSSSNQFQCVLEGLCASLLNSYSIRYRSTALNDGSSRAQLKMRIYRPGSCGEAVLETAACSLEESQVA